MASFVSALGGIQIGRSQARDTDKAFHQNQVNRGGCLREFLKATSECHPREIQRRRDPGDRVVDVEACVKATEALRLCFASNPDMFRHLYIPRMEYGLDEDLKPSPDEVTAESYFSYRWWTGMRRS